MAEETKVKYEGEIERWTGSGPQWGRIYAFIWRYRNEYGEDFEKDPRRVVQQIAQDVGIDFHIDDPICKRMIRNLGTPEPTDLEGLFDSIVNGPETATLTVRLSC